MDPVGALIGTILLGLGSIVLFGAVKNKKVFGAGGIIPTALTTGTISDLTKVPQAFDQLDMQKQATAGDVIDGLLGSAPDTATWVVPLTVQSAIGNIASVDAALADNIAAQVNKIDSNSTRAQLMPLAQLLALADGKGRKTDSDVIRLYMKGLTGESI